MLSLILAQPEKRVLYFPLKYIRYPGGAEARKTIVRTQATAEGGAASNRKNIAFYSFVGKITISS
jgi:hypothetical protein